MSEESNREIVCLCGSTKFKEEYRTENARLTLEGKIVLSVGFFHHADGTPDAVDEVVESFEDSGVKADLDELHKRKIDLADRIHVINVGGYTGESTGSEIRYAMETGDTDISWLEPEMAVFPTHKCPECGSIDRATLWGVRCCAVCEVSVASFYDPTIDRGDLVARARSEAV